MPRGHGWVKPLPTGAQARCGGPGMCSGCQWEAEAEKLRRELGIAEAVEDNLIDNNTRLRAALEKIIATPYTVAGDSDTILDACLGIAQRELNGVSAPAAPVCHRHVGRDPHCAICAP